MILTLRDTTPGSKACRTRHKAKLAEWSTKCRELMLLLVMTNDTHPQSLLYPAVVLWIELQETCNTIARRLYWSRTMIWINKIDLHFICTMNLAPSLTRPTFWPSLWTRFFFILQLSRRYFQTAALKIEFYFRTQLCVREKQNSLWQGRFQASAARPLSLSDWI